MDNTTFVKKVAECLAFAFGGVSQLKDEYIAGAICGCMNNGTYPMTPGCADWFIVHEFTEQLLGFLFPDPEDRERGYYNAENIKFLAIKEYRRLNRIL